MIDKTHLEARIDEIDGAIAKTEQEIIQIEKMLAQHKERLLLQRGARSEVGFQLGKLMTVESEAGDQEPAEA